MLLRMQPGCPETRIFLPDSLGDDLIIEIQDSNGQYLGRVVVQVAVLADEPSHRLRWWPIYHEPQHDLIGRLQLHIDYTTSSDDSHHLKCGSVAETVAYDHVLEVAMEVQHFQQRNLLLYGPWKWLVAKFASYYGVSDTYTKLRYLSYVMDGNRKRAFSHQENRILGEIEDQVDQILALVFENYKSLDESSPSGMKDVFEAATGIAAPALAPAFRLYTLLHDTSSSEEQFKLCRYLQSAVKKRSRRHLLETDDLIFSCKGGTLMDPVTLSDSYQKMITLILSFRNEIFTDIEICNQPVLPSFIDLPNLSSSIYSVDLSSRLREFLIACPPPGPSPPVVELLLATADLQRDLVGLNISPIKNGVDAKELFHSYINIWIQDKRLDLLESCKVDKAKCFGVKTQHSTTPFVEDMYDQLEETLKEYEIIIFRWPEYINVLENAIADVEKAILEALDRQYADVLSPLKDELLLNSLKRMLDVLQPKIETHLTSWSSSISTDENAIIGEHLSEVAVMLRATFRNYLQAIEEKLAENTRLQNATKLKKIIEDLKETVTESDIRSRMQPLKDLVIQTIDQLHTVVSPHVFTAICRRFWNHMGQELLHYLENRPEESSWYKGLRIALDTLDEIFTSEMQKLIGNALQTRDLEQPRFIMQLHSMLSKDAVNYKDNNYYY
ncbi:Pesticidal crystal cry8Ba protein [Quillaja saponaria]|uniref:Pesticidal crystal cry8Ba protein n=1 Tax=Quillaja saponaria TaxID=32244 RepID=A0AAD7KPP0_QUISA|nr:Pesticidal crystal cry8Ba protein [Quillaja saponaria]